MAERNFDRTNSGLLAPNDRKEKDTHADWRGSLNVEGVEFWVDCWDKQGKHGPIRTLSIRRKDVRPQDRDPAPRRGPASRKYPNRHEIAERDRLRQAPRSPAPAGDIDDDLPF